MFFCRMYSSVSSFSLTLCVGLCALDKTATCLSIDKVVSWRRCTSLITLAQVLVCPSNPLDYPSRFLFLVALRICGYAKT